MGCRTKIQGPCYFSCEGKKLEANIPLMQPPFLNKPRLWDTRGPEQGAGCWAFPYSSQLLLARSWTRQRWGTRAHSATFLAGSSFLGLFLWRFPVPPPASLLTTTLNENLCSGLWQSGLFDGAAIFSSTWKVNATLTSFKQRLSFSYGNSINAYT